jgi:hypothetical protein
LECETLVVAGVESVRTALGATDTVKIDPSEDIRVT